MAAIPPPVADVSTPPRSPGIRRKSGVVSPTSFEGLRAEGIRRVQTLSGHTWTDFNLHDPGVTILEQLCYALTDLVYRAEFPVADHLSGGNGRIDFAGLALHGPEQVFPCRPTTVADYRRALLDTVARIDNAWVWTDNDGSEAADIDSSEATARVIGLYRIAVKHNDTDQVATEKDERAALAQVRHVYRCNRNLCEDLTAVTSAQAVDCDLHGEFEIGGPRSAEEILADIYHHCAHAIAGRVVFDSFERALQQGRPLEDLLNSWHTRHGVVDDEALRRADREELFVGDVAAQVGKIDGVRAVRHLALCKKGEAPTSGSLRWRARKDALRLSLPEDLHKLALKLDNVHVWRAGRKVEVSAADVQAIYHQLQASHQNQSPGRQDIAALRRPPRGKRRQPQRYVSIQNQFPVVYGINAQGLPASATPGERAHAAQLKAYLLLFEKIIADGVVQLQHLRDLFSTRDVHQTYWRKRLVYRPTPFAGNVGADRQWLASDVIIPGIGALRDIGEPQDAQPDDFIGRRNRVLDYLLALHGEIYPQNSLRQLLPGLGPAELEKVLLENKRSYLRQVVRIGRDRVGGFDYGSASWDVASDAPPNVSGLQWRVSLLLGFRHQDSRPLAIDPDPDSDGMHVIEHVLLRPTVIAPLYPAAFYSMRLTVVFPAWTARGKDDEFRRFAEETVQLNCPAHVHPECLWLEFDDMVEFEETYKAWLAAKLAACNAEDNNDRERAVAFAIADIESAAVARFLLDKGVRVVAGEPHG